MARFASGLLAADNLIGPNKDRDNFGLLTARDVIGTIMGWGLFRPVAGPWAVLHVSGPTYYSASENPIEISGKNGDDGLLGLLKAQIY